MHKSLLFSVFKKVSKPFTGKSIGNFPLFNIPYRFLLRRLRPDFVEFMGHRMFLDPEDALSLSVRGYHEKFQTALFEKEIKEGDVVLDLGSNIGYYTLIAARCVGEDGKVFAFEQMLSILLY